MSRLYLVFLLILPIVTFSQDFTKKYFEHAKKQKLEGDYIEALEYLKKVLNSDSNKVEYLWEYAETLRLYKDYREAERVYQKIYQKEEAKIYKRSILYLGLMQKHNEKYDDAIETFKKAKKKYADNKKSYLYIKVTQEIESCLWAKKAKKDLQELTISKLSDEINTADSEFAHTIEGDVLYFSSLRADSTKQNQEIIGKEYKNQLFKTSINSPSITEKFIDFDNEKMHLGNGTFSLDKKKYYFTACKDHEGQFLCKILVGNFENGVINSIDTLDEIINEVGANTTMPFITKFDGNEVLFFSSNRSDSKGGMDIFYSYFKNNTFGQPIAVSEINSIEDEISPFYDSNKNILYFSSNWHYGFGGFDIFSSDFENYKFQKPVNVGLPINSPANDLYFFKNRSKSFLSSNRIGSNFVNNPTCCSDIFYLDLSPKKEMIVEEINSSPTSAKNEFKSLEELNNKLPVTLYFHNDVPNPKSNDTTTKLNYLSTYEEYIKMIPTYQKEYSKGLSGEKAKDAEEDIESFFIEFVNQGVKDLEIFRELLLKELKEKKSIVLTVKGFASPLAKSDYNVNLTKRRIVSLTNYLSEYDKGVFKPFLSGENETKLIINEVPFGEYVANKLVSDNPNDMKNSVYSRVAGLERKIEIQSASYLKNDSSNYLVSKKQLIDLGVISSNQKKSTIFEVKNTSSNPIEISKIDIPCNCNTASSNKNKLNSNEVAKIEVSFDPIGYTGKIVKSVYIYTENSKEPLRLIITAEVK
jgi:tetratricopeptide (TPR) repeat protein